ncbi:hypothetical protein Ga0466249_002830 [Sporomusaceae bacterium BoRhaA]|nr:hypothetical protein [Pelorhabdus rhamnosifermentans]
MKFQQKMACEKQYLNASSDWFVIKRITCDIISHHIAGGDQIGI